MTDKPNEKKRLREGCILDYIDAPKAKKQKADRETMESVLDNFTLEELLTIFNKKVEKHKCGLFICYGCDKVSQHSKFANDDYLATSKWGEERPFCSDCKLWCGDEPYSPDMAHYHEDCACQKVTDTSYDSGNEEVGQDPHE